MELIKKKVRCYKCNGIGLIETDFILCNNCKGSKCFACKGTGILQYAWSECPRCIGLGIDDKYTKLYDKLNKQSLKIKKSKYVD